MILKTIENFISYGRNNKKRRFKEVITISLLLTNAAASAQETAPQVLTLEDALQRLAQSPSVTQAQLSVQVAQANLNAARAALGLSVAVTGNASYAGATTAADGSITAGNIGGSAGVNVSLGILPWSSNQSSLRTAQRSLTLAQARLILAQNTARLNVVQQYLSAVIATGDVALAARTLDTRQRQLTVAQTQQQNGNATVQDVLSAQANLQAAQASQLQAQASLDSAQRSLGAALGTNFLGLNLLTTPQESFTLPDVNVLVAQARMSREEVIEAQNTLAAAQENLEQTRRDATLPDLTAAVRYGPATGGGLNTSLNVKQGTLNAGYSLPFGSDNSSPSRLVTSVSGSYVVYSPAQKAQISAAQASVTQAQLSLSVAQQNAELDVRSKYNAAQSALSTLQAKTTQVQVAQLGLEAAQTRLQLGTVTQDDVTAAEIALATARRDLNNARASAQIALLQLATAAGGNV